MGHRAKLDYDKRRSVNRRHEPDKVVTTWTPPRVWEKRKAAARRSPTGVLLRIPRK